MAFCSYFKIQPVAGGADRIKKSEWKLVSHDNSQPPRERQLLVPLLSPDSASLPFLRSISISLSPPFAVPSLFSISFLGLQHQRFHSPLLFLLHPSSPLAIPSHSVPNDSPNLSPVQLLPPVSSPPPTIAIAIVNRFKYTIAIRVILCIYIYICGPVEYRRALCICRKYINIYANAHRCALDTHTYARHRAHPPLLSRSPQLIASSACFHGDC